MSTYLATEAALLALVRRYNAGATFTAANCLADDWLVLDARNTEVAAVIEMAEASAEGDNLSGHGSQGVYQDVHKLALWICVKRGVGVNGDGAAKATCKTLTESLKDYLRPYERLNHGAPIARAQLGRTDAPSHLSPTNDISAATHVAQRILLTVQCEASVVVTEPGV